MANTTNLDLEKPLGTDHALISVINSNMDKIDAYAGKTDDAIGGLADGLAIVTNGDTHVAITSGQFVYVRNHNTLSEGLYVATANIAQDETLSGSNLTADSSGGLNSVYSALNGKMTTTTVEELTTTNEVTGGKLRCIRRMDIINIELDGITFSSAGNHTVAYLPASAHDGRGNAFLVIAGVNCRLAGITAGGTLSIYGAEANAAYYGNLAIIK